VVQPVIQFDANSLKLPENRRASARVPGGDQYLCTCQGKAGLQRVVRGEVARQCLDALSTGTPGSQGGYVVSCTRLV
jgi:hypothetical protein